MLEKSFTILFYLKKRGNYVKGPVPIYVRLTVDGVPKELSVKRTWEPSRWNKDSCRAVGNKEDARLLNEFLDMIQAKVYDVRRKLIESCIQVTSAAPMDIVSGHDQRGKMLLAIFREHNNKMKALIGTDYAKGTYKRFEIALQHIGSCVTSKYKLDDINIYSLNADFVNDLSFWFKAVRHCSHNTIMKYITDIKKVVLQCVDNGWLAKDPFASFSLRLEENEPVFLTKEELQGIIKKEIHNPRMQSVRDIFIFAVSPALHSSM